MTEDMFNQLSMVVEYGEDEYSEFITYLMKLCQYRWAFSSPEFKKVFDQELQYHYENIKENCKLEEDVEVVKKVYRYLVWND